MKKNIILILFLLIGLTIQQNLPQIGVCYYPEQWPSNLWEKDISEMAELGIKYVRIGI